MWSIAPDRSWAYLNRGLPYLALSRCSGCTQGHSCAGVRSRRRRGCSRFCFSACSGGRCSARFSRASSPTGARGAATEPDRLLDALALIAALALPLGLWLAAGRRHARVVRAGGIVLLYVASISLVLTYSRARIAVAAAGVVLWLWLCRDRFEGLIMLVAGAGPGLVVAAWASTQSGLVDHLQTSATRRRAGAWFALALALGVAAALGLSHYGTRVGERFSDEERHRWTTRLGAGIAGVAAVALIAATIAIGGPDEWFDGFRGGDVAQGSGRLAELSSNNRWTWWQESWAVPRRARRADTARIRSRSRGARCASALSSARNRTTSACSRWPNWESSGCCSASAPRGSLLACWEAVRRLDGDEGRLRRRSPCCRRSTCCTRWRTSTGTSSPPRLRSWWRSVCCCPRAARRPSRAAARCWRSVREASRWPSYSITAPWISQRRVEDAYSAIARGDAGAARSAARQARDLNPLSVEPLWA